MEFTLDQLKQIADKVNMEYHTSIGMVKLRERLEEHLKMRDTTIEEVLHSLDTKNENLTADGVIDGLGVVPKNPGIPGVTEEEIERLRKLSFATATIDQNKKAEAQQIKDASKLLRVRVICNNPNKSAYTGDIFSVHNDFVSETKFVSFGVPTHISQMMFNALSEKMCQQFYKQRANGREVTKTKHINEYTIEILPPLTRNEIEAIARKQLAEGSIGVDE